MSENNFWKSFNIGFMHGMFGCPPFMGGCMGNFAYGGFSSFNSCFSPMDMMYMVPNTMYMNFSPFSFTPQFNSVPYLDPFASMTQNNPLNNFSYQSNTLAPKSSVWDSFSYNPMKNSQSFETFTRANSTQTNSETTATSTDITKKTSSSLDFGYSNFGSVTASNKKTKKASKTKTKKSTTQKTSSSKNEIRNYSFSSTPAKTRTITSNSTTRASYVSNDVNEKFFDTMLEAILDREGRVCTKIEGDRGGWTNHGVIQSTYDIYRNRKNLPQQHVRNMTEEEMREIYHGIFVDSGASKIDNPQIAFFVFDTAVNFGPSVGKKMFEESGGNFDKLIKIRQNRYENIVKNNPSQRKFLRGWTNRIEIVTDFAKENLPDKATV